MFCFRLQFPLPVIITSYLWSIASLGLAGCRLAYWCSFLPRCMQCRRGIVRRILSVCLSVCLSVTRMIPDKTEERSVQIFIPYERTFILVLWGGRMVGGGRPLLPEILGQPTPGWNEIADFQPIIARSSSAVAPSKKVQLTLIGSPLRAFRWA